MNKKVFGVMLVLLLLAVTVIPVLAGPPKVAEGRWNYYPILVDRKFAGCNVFDTTFENGLWTGTFAGASTEDGKVVVHCTGELSFNAIVTFEEVTVDGKTGGLEMSVVGWWPPDATEWIGYWVITQGTGELKSLHGQGTWHGVGAGDYNQWGYVDYAGSYQFAPQN